MNCPDCGQELSRAPHLCPARRAEPAPEFVDVFFTRVPRLDALPALERYLQQLLPHLDSLTISLLFQHLPAAILRNQDRTQAEIVRQEMAALGAEVQIKAVSPARSARPAPARPRPGGVRPPDQATADGSRRVWTIFLLGALLIGFTYYYLPAWLSRRPLEPERTAPSLAWRSASPLLTPQVSSSPTPQPGQPALPHDPRQAQIQSLLEQSVREYQNHQYTTAIQTTEQVLDLDPNQATAKRNLGIIYCEMGWDDLQKNKSDDAKDMFNEALQVSPGSQCAFRGLGFSYFAKDDLDRALEWLNRYFDTGGVEADAYALISEIYYRRNDLKKALEFLRMAVALDPKPAAWQERLTKLERELKVEKNFLAGDTRHFVVKYEGYDQAEVGSWVMTLLEEAFLRVGGELHYYPQNPITAILYTDQQFQDVTHLPAWAGAAYDGKIRIPAKGLRQGDEAVARIITHEYTHAVLHLWSRGHAPTWLHEGLAQALEGETADTAVSRLAGAGQRLFPLRLLERPFIRLPELQAKLAYSESLLAILFIRQTYGDYTIRAIIEALAESKNMEQALQDTTYLNYDQFDKKFLEWVIQNYGNQ